MPQGLARNVLLALALAGSGLAQQPVLFFIGEWEPYTSSSLPNKGCATELVAAACKAGGIEPAFEFFPWPRAEAMVEAGQAFCAFPYASNKQRAATFDFSDALFYTAPKFIYWKKTRSFEGLSASSLAGLKAYSVALLSGTWTEKDLKAAGIRVQLVNSLEGGVRMLQAGRVDFLVEDEVVAFEMIRKLFPGEAGMFKSLPVAIWGAKANYLLVSRTYPNAAGILGRFNRGLKEIKRNGTYKQITSNYKMKTL
jgi:polar amino acid transport system substrate-binding protein